MKLRYILIIALTIIISSCKDTLVEEPKSFISPDQFFTSESEVESAIYGVYDFLHDGNLGGGHFFYGEEGSDISAGRLTTFRRGLIQQFDGGLGVWRTHYSAIGAANMVISRLESSENFSAAFKEEIIAEAKFLRAFFYYQLNMYWGNVPVWLGELDLAEVETLPNTTPNDVRKQIIEDLIDASNGLPTTAAQEGRVTSWTAKGLLARVYLFEKDWQKAIDMANDVINNSDHELVATHQELFDWQNKSNSEMLHVIPKQTNIQGSEIHTNVAPRPRDDGPFIQEILDADPSLQVVRPDGKLSTDVDSFSSGSVFQGLGTIQCLKEHYDSHEPGDLRKDLIWHIVEFTDGSTYELTGGSSAVVGRGGYYPLKWFAYDEDPENGSRDIHRQRLAELYLILAEAGK